MEDIKQLKILVVDDETELLRLVESILRKEGFCRIYTAEDGVKAMELFENVKPDAAILDVMLPEIDGFTLLQRMRAVSQLPVLFLSAKGENEDRLLGLGIGADDYIVKPFLPKELTLRLCAVLRRVYQPKGNQQGRLPVFELGQARVNLNTGTVLKNGCEVKLTAKEYMLLKKLYAVSYTHLPTPEATPTAEPEESPTPSPEGTEESPSPTPSASASPSPTPEA